MAGDWIKMRVGLGDDPAVIAIATSTGLDTDTVVGKLHRTWSWSDRHTADGWLPGVTAAWLDRFVGKRGFAAAMAATSPPWLVIKTDGLMIPKFDRHNGTSAKSRAENTERQRLSRATRDNSATEARPEKRREEIEKNTAAAEQNGHAAAAAEVSADEWKQAKPIAMQLFKACWPDTNLTDHGPDRQRWLAQLGVLAVRRGNGFFDPLITALRRTTPTKPEGFVGKLLNDQLVAQGTTLDLELRQIIVPDFVLPANNHTKETSNAS